MNIWIVNQFAMSPEDFGGNRHLTIAAALVKRGHKVGIVASRFAIGNTDEKKDEPGVTEQVFDGVTFVRFRTGPHGRSLWGRVRNMLSFATWVMSQRPLQALGTPDLVLGSSPTPLVAWAAQRVARRHRVPFVLEVRDIWPESVVELKGLSPRHPGILLIDAIMQRLYRRAAHIFMTMSHGKAYLASRGIDKTKADVLPQLLDLGQIPYSLPPADKAPFVFMYSGTVGLNNRLNDVLEACARLQAQHPDHGIRVRVVGNGAEKPTLIERAKSLGLDWVSFEPAVPKADVFKTLSEAHAFLIPVKDSPLYQWGFSANKLLDYMAMARPVIMATSAPTNPVDEAQCGKVVPSGNTDELARALYEMSKAPRESLLFWGLNGRRFAEQNHDVTLEIDRLDRILQRVVKNANADKRLASLHQSPT